MKGSAVLDSLVPADFEVVKNADSVLAIRRDAGEHLKKLTLSRSGARAGDAQAFQGRGTTERLVYDPVRQLRAVFRRYRRGGLLRWLTRDKLFGWIRPFRELEVAETARGQGVPTVEVLAVRVDRVGPFLYTGEMVTRELEDAPDLVQWLQASHPPVPGLRRAMIHVVAQAVASLHRAGVLHSDLHLKNLLVRDGQPPLAYVIDLDKAIHCSGLRSGPATRLGNLRRLDRSVEKFNLLYRGRVSRADRVRFLYTYLEAVDSRQDRRTVLRRLRARYGLHRLRWRLFSWLRGKRLS